MSDIDISENSPKKLDNQQKTQHFFENFRYITEDDVINYDLQSQNTYDSYFEEEKQYKKEPPLIPKITKTKSSKSKVQKPSKNISTRTPEEIELF